MLVDYVKSFPTVYWNENNHWKGYDMNNPDTKFSNQIAVGTGMWIGGLALMTDILFSGMAEASSVLPYIRALICGVSYSGFNNLWSPGTHGKYYDWLFNLYEHDQAKVGGMASLLAFMVGFMGTRNNVGGGPWATGGHIGLATASAMIDNPYVFRTGSSTDGTPYGFELGKYAGLVFAYALTLGGASKLLSSRVSPTALAVIIGALNVMLQKKRLQSVVWGWFGPPPPITTHPYQPPPTRNYAFY